MAGTRDPGNGYQRDQAYHRLRRLIILQQVPEGERLRESAWANRLDVNRTALREAFARLEAEGVIQKGPKTGYFIPDLSGEDIGEIKEVRVVLEGAAIERICRLGLNTPEYLKTLLDACDQLERLLKEDYVLGVAEADRRFHVELVEIAGNRRLTMLYHRAPLPIIFPEVVNGPQWLERANLTLREHRDILDAILSGDPSGAQELLRTHLGERSVMPLRGG